MQCVSAAHLAFQASRPFAQGSVFSPLTLRELSACLVNGVGLLAQSVALALLLGLFQEDPESLLGAGDVLKIAIRLLEALRLGRELPGQGLDRVDLTQRHFSELRKAQEHARSRPRPRGRSRKRAGLRDPWGERTSGLARWGAVRRRTSGRLAWEWNGFLAGSCFQTLVFTLVDLRDCSYPDHHTLDERP